MYRTSHLWLLLPVLLGVAAFGTIGANADPLWFDEFWSVFNAGLATYDGPARAEPLSLLEVWRQVAEIDPIHPPGYALILAVWARLGGGWSVFGGRMLSTWAALLSIAVIYRAGRDVLTPRAGLVAAWLLGTTAFYAHYFHELRMYAVLMLLVCMVIWSYWYLETHGIRLFAGVVFVVSLAGLVYTQYLSVFVIVGIGLYHLLLGRKTRRWWWITALALGAGALYFPWTENVWALYGAVSGGADRAGVFSTQQIIRRGAIVGSNGLPLIMPILLAVGFVGVGTVRARAFLYINLMAIGTLMLLINATTGMFIHIRYLLVMFPVLLLIYAAALARLPRPVTAILVGCWVLIGVWGYPEFEARHNRDDQWTLPWSDVAVALEGQTMPDDVVIVQAVGTRIWWDYAQTAAYYLSEDVPATVTITPLRPWTDEDVYDQQVEEQARDAARIFHVIDISRPTDRPDALATALEPDYQQCDSSEVGTLRITLYAQDCESKTSTAD